jgi:Bacterial capsule synthesis protein PGA_cap
MFTTCLFSAVFFAPSASFFIWSYWPSRRSLATESDWAHRKSPWWQIYYGSKYLNPIRKAERYSDLEEYFLRDMSLPKERLGDKRIVTLTAVGDLMSREDLTSESCKHLWDEIGEQVFRSDLRIANMEFAVNPKDVIRKIVTFSVPTEQADPLLGDSRFGSFDLVSLANNHIYDSGYEGLKSTCDYLDQKKILHVGANPDAVDQDAFPVIEVGGVKIAVLAYTFSLNGIPMKADAPYSANHIRFNALDDKDYDPSLIHRHIRIAKERGADIIVSSHHWGIEFEYYPTKRLVTRAHDLLEAGIDLIIGHHPHIISQSERYQTRDGRSAFVLYSLGNLTSWALKHPIHRMSQIAKIEIESGLNAQKQKIHRIGDVTLTPSVHLMQKVRGQITHKILPLYETSKKIHEDQASTGLSFWNRQIIKHCEKQHRKYFRQKGIVYE